MSVPAHVPAALMYPDQVIYGLGGASWHAGGRIRAGRVCAARSTSADGYGTRVRRAAIRGQDVGANFRSQRRSGLSQTTSRSALLRTTSGNACRLDCQKFARRGPAAPGSVASRHNAVGASATIRRTCCRAAWCAPYVVGASLRSAARGVDITVACELRDEPVRTDSCPTNPR